MTAPEWSGLQSDDCFATHPVAACVKRVPRNDEHVSAITGNAAMSPDSAANSRRRPGVYVGRTVDIDTHNPAVITAAVAVSSQSRTRTRSRSQEPVHRALPAPRSQR